jgi:hypothetical protein
MRCTTCDEIIRPVVALDIDGTLGDYHGHFIDFAEQYIGRDLFRNYTGDSSFRLWFSTANYIGTEQFRAIKLAYRQGGMKRSMPVYDHALDLYHAILDHDAELWMTTTRPYLSLDTVVPDTVAWCARNGFTDFDGMLFDEDKYAKLLERVDERRIVTVIDDLPDMCENADKLVGRPVSLQPATRWNEDADFRRIPMTVIIEKVIQDIEYWKEENGLCEGTPAGVGSGQLDLLGENGDPGTDVA